MLSIWGTGSLPGGSHGIVVPTEVVVMEAFANALIVE